MRLIAKIFVVTLFIVIIFCSNAIAEKEWAITVYGVRLTPDSLGDTLSLHAHYMDSFLLAVALSRKVFSFERYMDIEAEGQAVKHFGVQNHLEFNGLLALRWLVFPFDRLIDTSIAVGAGLSYASKTPALEAIGVSYTPKLLGYLMFEIALTYPKFSRWSFVTRLHHRSGANGLFGARRDASNGWGFGIKYSF
jgi:hypothetical protein